LKSRQCVDKQVLPLCCDFNTNHLVFLGPFLRLTVSAIQHPISASSFNTTHVELELARDATLPNVPLREDVWLNLECEELYMHYSHKCFEALLKATKSSLEILRKRCLLNRCVVNCNLYTGYKYENIYALYFSITVCIFALQTRIIKSYMCRLCHSIS